MRMNRLCDDSQSMPFDALVVDSVKHLNAAYSIRLHDLKMTRCFLPDAQ